MTPQQPFGPRGNKKTLIIGVDFGTHSTKVVLRERGKADGRIVGFDDHAKGYPLLASPSVIRQVGDRLFFGTFALNMSGGTLYSSLKVTLLSNSPHDAVHSLGNLESPTLVAAYLAWAFQRVHKSPLVNDYANVFLNVAAPMSHVEDPKLKARYLRIVQASWKLTFDGRMIPVEQGISASRVGGLLDPLMAASIQGSELRRFDVLPETIAPVVSLSLDPFMKPSIYVIVDMGAGTTEMSVFHAGDPGADQKVLCYKDKTILLGANDLQRAAQTGTSQGSCKVAEIVNRILSEYRSIWKCGYRVDAANPLSKRRWKDLILVLSGGGTRDADVQHQLRLTNPVPPWRDCKTSFEARRHIPGTLPLAEGMSEDDGSMFAVANGLAIERKKWPIVFEPHEIEPLTAPEPEKPRDNWGDSEYRPRWV